MGVGSARRQAFNSWRPVEETPEQTANVANGQSFRAEVPNGLTREPGGVFGRLCGFLGGSA